jgi:hypothetical protein
MVVSKSSGGRVFCFAVGSSLQIHSLRKVQTLYTHVLDALLACVSNIQTPFAEVMQHPSSSRLSMSLDGSLRRLFGEVGHTTSSANA